MAAKIQLNLSVASELSERFREAARDEGFGKHPSPFLTQLMAAYEGDLGAVYKALVRARRERPETSFTDDRQRAFAREIVLALADLLEDPEDEADVDA